MDSNGGMIVITKTNATVIAYLKRGKLLWNQAAKELGSTPNILLPTDYLIWLKEKLPKLKPASRRLYLASTKEFLNHILISDGSYGGGKENLNSTLELSSKLQSIDFNPKFKYSLPSRTSNQKAKKINFSELKFLVQKTQGMKGKWIKAALIWMLANILVGLRPSEWRSASLTVAGGKFILVVVNGKNTNGRAHGLLRHINVTNLEPQDLNWVKLQLQAVRQYVKNDATWEGYYGGVRKTIHKITRKFLSKRDKHMSLYSARHQFSANAKSIGMSKVEVAALMGHAVDGTAGFHYGKKKHGTGNCGVQADPTDMLKVRIKPTPQTIQSPRIGM